MTIRANAPTDPEACPGCGCLPGNGTTSGCNDPDGCGYLRDDPAAPGRIGNYAAAPTEAETMRRLSSVPWPGAPATRLRVNGRAVTIHGAAYHIAVFMAQTATPALGVRTVALGIPGETTESRRAAALDLEGRP